MEEKVKSLFFNETLRMWHFEDIVKELGISRERANYFLKTLVKNNLVSRVKPKGRMPYYIANRDNPKFRSEKRLYGLDILQKTGLFEHLNSLENVKTAILFGSFSRGDWSKSSDIDLFIYGNDSSFRKDEFEIKAKRQIQVFSYKNQKSIKKELEPKVIENIAKGFNITESIAPFEVVING